MLQRLDDVVACRPDAVTLLVGTNDVLATLGPPWEPMYRRQQHIPVTPTLAWYVENVREIIDRLRAETGARLAILDLPPLGEDLASEINGRVREYNAALREVAAETGVQVLPLHDRLVALLPEGHTPPPFEGRRDLMGSALVRRLVLRRSWNEISAAHGLTILTDHVHLDDRAAAVVADLIEDWLAAPEDAPHNPRVNRIPSQFSRRSQSATAISRRPDPISIARWCDVTNRTTDRCRAPASSESSTSGSPKPETEHEERHEPEDGVPESHGHRDQRRQERPGAGQGDRPQHHPVDIRLAVRVADHGHGHARQAVERVAPGEQQQAQHDQERVDERHQERGDAPDRRRHRDQHHPDEHHRGEHAHQDQEPQEARGPPPGQRLRVRGEVREEAWVERQEAGARGAREARREDRDELTHQTPAFSTICSTDSWPVENSTSPVGETKMTGTLGGLMAFGPNSASRALASSLPATA